MSFITSPGVIVPPLTAGGVAYGTGGQAKVNSAGTAGQALLSGGAGVPTWGTPTGAVSPPYTAGAVAYGTGSGLSLNAVGIAGQVLTSQGAGAPTFVTASSGAMVLLQTITANNSATVDLETGIGSTYDAYVILVSGWVTGSGLYVNLKIGGSYRTDAFYSFVYNASTSNASTYTGTNQSNYAFGIGISADGDLQGNSTIYFNSPSSTTLIKQLSYTGMSFINGGPSHVRTNIGVGNYSNLTSALTGVRFKSGSGNITSGTFSLYGFAK
jgi:hypothetical protein